MKISSPLAAALMLADRLEAGVREAHRLGKTCPPLIAMSIRELLALDLADARARLGITPAVWYKACHDVWRSEGIDPYDLLGKAIPEKKLAA